MHTNPVLRGAVHVPPERVAQALEQPRNRVAPTVLHLQRLLAAWSYRHLADRFMWIDGVATVAEPFSGGENHCYVILRSNAQAVAACVVVGAAVGTVAPAQGSCRRLSTVFTMLSCMASRCIHAMAPGRRAAGSCCLLKWRPRARIGPSSRRQTRGA